jgi:hypothetical protein
LKAVTYQYLPVLVTNKMTSIVDINTLRAELEAQKASMEELTKKIATAEREAELDAIPKRTTGTKLKWVSDDNNYRVAVITADGVLEVKRVVGGELKRISRSEFFVLAQHRRLFDLPYLKTFFKTEREWRLSLPNNGSVTVTPYVYGAVERDWNAIKPEMSDPEKLQQLMKRFCVRATVRTATPPQQMYELAKERVAKGGSSKDNVGNWMERNVRSWEAHIATMTEQQKNYANPSIRNTCTGRMLLSTGDMVREIAVEQYKGKLYIVNDDGKRYTSFADMDCLNAKGQPKLTVYYRKKYIGLANLF